MRALCAVAIFIGLLMSSAWAHGSAEWIQRGQYKNGAGELCCGERDCGYQVSGEITATPAGWKVNAVFMGRSGTEVFYHNAVEIVPFNEATPSPDGKFWRCQWGGKRKCFFFPPRSY